MTEHPSLAASERPGDATAGGEAATLDAIFRRNARRRPDAPALIDPPDRPALCGGRARRLTYAEADRAVSALAGRLRELGLPAGTPVGLQLANTVESIVALLAVLRAGLIAAPLPLLWRQAEASAALRQVGARALIACTRIGDIDHGAIALEIAAETFGIRFVCGFGEAMPDGMVPLDDIFLAAPDSEAGPAQTAADAVAVITFDSAAAGPTPTARSHTELLVGGMAVVLEGRLPRHAAVLGTMLTASFATLATSVIPFLLTGGALTLHQPFDPAVLAEQCRRDRFDAVVIPGALVKPLYDAGIVGTRQKAVIAVWRSPEAQGGSPAHAGDAVLIDVLAFGEWGVVAMRRDAHGAAAALTPGAVTAPRTDAGAPVVITLARTACGTLALGGPMVPHRRLPPGGAGPAAAEPAAAGVEVDTGYPCRIDPDSGRLTVTAGPPGFVSVGGYRFALRELQDVVGRIEPHGVLAALPDLLAGQKLTGLAADPAAIRQALAALGVNPLVGSAFRDRRGKRAPAA